MLAAAPFFFNCVFFLLFFIFFFFVNWSGFFRHHYNFEKKYKEIKINKIKWWKIFTMKKINFLFLYFLRVFFITFYRWILTKCKEKSFFFIYILAKIFRGEVKKRWRKKKKRNLLFLYFLLSACIFEELPEFYK